MNVVRDGASFPELHARLHSRTAHMPSFQNCPNAFIPNFPERLSGELCCSSRTARALSINFFSGARTVRLNVSNLELHARFSIPELPEGLSIDLCCSGKNCMHAVPSTSSAVPSASIPELPERYPSTSSAAASTLPFLNCPHAFTPELSGRCSSTSSAAPQQFHSSLGSVSAGFRVGSGWGPARSLSRECSISVD